MTDAYEWNRFVAQDSDAYDAMAASAAEKAADCEAKGSPAHRRSALTLRLHERYHKAVARAIRKLRIPVADPPTRVTREAATAAHR